MPNTEESIGYGFAELSEGYDRDNLAMVLGNYAWSRHVQRLDIGDDGVVDKISYVWIPVELGEMPTVTT